MTGQGRMRDIAVSFQKGSRPGVELLRRKGGEGQQSEQGGGRCTQI